MPTLVGSLNAVNSSVTPSNASESDAKPFSLTDLLRGHTEQDSNTPEEAAMLDEGTPQDMTDEPETADSSASYLYWQMPFIPMTITNVAQPFSQLNTQEQLEIPTTDVTEFFENTSQYSEDRPLPVLEVLTTQAATELEAVLPLPSEAISTEIQAETFEPFVKMSVNTTQDAKAISTVEGETQSEVMKNMNNDNPDEMIQRPLFPIEKNQEVSFQTTQPFSTEASAVSLFQPIQPQYIQMKATAPTNDSQQEDTTTIQFISQHLNDVLSQKVGPILSESTAQQVPLAQKGDVSSQITMELMSLQPEVISTGAGVNIDSYTAQIKIHPEELGPITAKIEMNDGIASITFMTEHAHVKQLMEVNLPELRHAFQNSSLNLTSVDIHHGGHQDKKGQSEYPKTQDEPDGTLRFKSNQNQDSQAPKASHLIIDTYA